MITTARERLAGEVPLTPSAAAKLVPGRAGTVAAYTVVRWIRVGVTGTHGRRVFLDGYLAGGRWVTSAAAVERFLAALTDADGGGEYRSPAEQRQALRAAQAEATALGL